MQKAARKLLVKLTAEKLLKRLSYEKAARKMLVKLSNRSPKKMHRYPLPPSPKQKQKSPPPLQPQQKTLTKDPADVPSFHPSMYKGGIIHSFHTLFAVDKFHLQLEII